MSTPRSGNPAKKAAAKKISTAAQWKTSSGIEDIEVPSGNIARLRRVGPEAFLSSGIVPDSLAPMIDEAIKQKKGLPPSKVAKKIAEDPESLPQMFDIMNRVVVYAVIEPNVENIPNCDRVIEGEVCDKTHFDPIHKLGEKGTHKFNEGERDPDTLYIDEVSLDDRLFIMNYAVGGTRDLERFRREHGESMAGLAPGKGVRQST